MRHRYKLVTDRIGGTDDAVEEFIEWQLTRYLSGEASLEDVTATITDSCDRMADTTKVRFVRRSFPVREASHE